MSQNCSAASCNNLIETFKLFDECELAILTPLHSYTIPQQCDVNPVIDAEPQSDSLTRKRIQHILIVLNLTKMKSKKITS